MLDLFDLFFENITPKTYRFERPVQDMKPVKIKRHDNGYIAVVNTLGIAEENLGIELVEKEGKQVIQISGETNNEELDFKNKINLSLHARSDEQIDDLAYEVKDGLTIIYIRVAKPKIETIVAKKLKSTDVDKFMNK